jgi:glycopeptide antibiotics resistance protein
VFHEIYALALGVPLLLALAYHRSRAGVGRDRVRLEFAFGLYLLLVTVVVLFPMRVSPALRADDAVWDYATFLRDWVNLVPFATITRVFAREPGQALRQLGGNLVLLAPLGVFAPALYPRFRRAGAMVVLAVASALGIELVQYLARVARLSLRSVDVDDALLNITGALVGYLVWVLWSWLARRRGVRDCGTT